MEDWAFDVEILWLAKRRGLRLEEIPVRWADRPGTKVRLLRDVASSLLGLGRIRWFALRAGYDTPTPVEATLESWSNGRESLEKMKGEASR